MDSPHHHQQLEPQQEHPLPTRLIVIRHGETEWNVRGVWQGQQNSPLTEQGERQAIAVAQRLKEFDLDAIYSSDLGRCIQSASPTAELVGLPLRQDFRLRERAFGVLEGMSKEESQKAYPGVWEGLSKKDVDFAPEGGESLRQKQTRFDAVYLDIARRHPGKTVAVFTHGGGVDAILRTALGIALTAGRPYTLWNCALNIVQYEATRWVVDTLGDVSHLKGFESAFRPR